MDCRGMIVSYFSVPVTYDSKLLAQFVWMMKVKVIASSGPAYWTLDSGQAFVECIERVDSMHECPATDCGWMLRKRSYCGSVQIKETCQLRRQLDKLPSCPFCPHESKFLWRCRTSASRVLIDGQLSMVNSHAPMNSGTTALTAPLRSSRGLLHSVFIARQHTDARYWYSKSVRLSVCLSVRLSICPSVTFRYQMKTAWHIVIVFFHHTVAQSF